MPPVNSPPPANPSPSAAVLSDAVAPIALPRLDLVIFDCDGVLIDSELIAARTMSETLADFGVTMSPRDALVTFTGEAVHVTLGRLRDEFGLKDPDAFIARWDAALEEGFRTSLAPVPGIEAVVRAIDRPVCVASNSASARLERSLHTLAIVERFGSHVFSADMVTRPKPAPDLLLHAARVMGARPARTVMIDDNEHGVEAAVAAGMPAIGFIAPGDPREGRKEVLRAAGADVVARGAEELGAALVQVNGTLAP